MVAVKVYSLTMMTISWLGISLFSYIYYKKTKLAAFRYSSILEFIVAIMIIIGGIQSPDIFWISMLQAYGAKAIYLGFALFPLATIGLILIKITDKKDA